MMCRNRFGAWLMAAAFALPLAAGAAHGQSRTPVQGFSPGNKQPINIEAASLEVRDKSRVAVFSGNVRVVQGETTVRCQSLTVFYEDPNAAANANAAKPRSGPLAAGGGQRISRLEAKGGVTVVQKDQTATGDVGYFDMRANTVTLVGNVTVSQGGNVVRGERLVADLTTGVSRVEAGKSQGPVRMMIQSRDGATGPGPSVPGFRRPANSGN